MAVTTGAVHYWHQDHLGSSSVITDNTGTLVQTLAYYPYGATRTNQSSANPAVDVPYKYTGKELDSTTGLYYYEARYYDPVLGRFMSADTIVPNPLDPQELNRYTYVGNNPFRYTDRTGHFKLAKVLDRIFENKVLRIAGWVLFPQQMVFVDPATRRYAVPAAAGAAGYVACAPVGLGSVCGGATAGAASALVSQSEGRGGNVGRSALAGGAAGAAGSFASGIVGCSVLCGGAAAGVVNAAIMGGDLRKGAIRGAIGGAVTAAYVVGMQYASSSATTQGNKAQNEDALNVDQSNNQAVLIAKNRSYTPPHEPRGNELGDRIGDMPGTANEYFEALHDAQQAADNARIEQHFLGSGPGDQHMSEMYGGQEGYKVYDLNGNLRDIYPGRHNIYGEGKILQRFTIPPPPPPLP